MTGNKIRLTETVFDETFSLIKKFLEHKNCKEFSYGFLPPTDGSLSPTLGILEISEVADYFGYSATLLKNSPTFGFNYIKKDK